MNLRPTQIVGLVAVVFFGGYLGYTLLKPKPDPMVLPSGVDLRKLPSVSDIVPAPDLMPVVPDMKIEPFTADMLVPDPMPKPKGGAATPPTSAEAELLAKGSQDARDDLYCAGVISAVDHAAAATLSSGLFARQNAILALSQSGGKKLAAEDKTLPLPQIADAHTDRAARDFDANKLRLSFPDCAKRAAALSPPMSSATPTPAPAAEPAKPAPPADPLAVGSQQARDDYYCAGVMTALGKAKANKIDPGDAIELKLAGDLALINENAVKDNDTADLIAKAWETKAAADVTANAARQTKEFCHARVETLRRTPVQH